MTNKITKSRHDFCFRRWTRASYAVFNSLHKVVKMGVISGSCSFLSLCFHSLSAQTPIDTLSNKEIVLEEVSVVPDKPIQTIVLRQAISYITRNEIEQAGVETLQDLLLYVQGVDLRTRGSNGIQADVSLRGGTFDQTIVLLNGINLTDPQTGHFSLHIPIHVEAIERIEVLEVPGLESCHAIAFSGCINIITRTPEENIFDLSVTGGMYGFIRAAANSHVRVKKFYFTLGGDINRSEGFTENTDYLQGNAFFRMLYKDRKYGTIDFQTGYQNKQFGANSFYSAAYKEQYEHTRVWFAGLNYSLKIDEWSIASSIYFRQHKDRFELFRHESPSWYTGHNYHKTILGGANVQAIRYYFKKGYTSIGMDYREENIWSNNLGETMDIPVAVFADKDSIFYDKTGKRQHLGLQLRQGFLWKNGEVSLTARGNLCKEYGFNWNLSTNVIWRLPKKIELNGFVQNVYRLPTFTDLYYQGANQMGNRNLQPEQAIVAGINSFWKPKQWNVGISMFYRYGFQIIDWVRLSLDDNWYCKNMTNVQAAGVDVSAVYFPKHEYLSQVGIQYNYLYVVKNSFDYHSLYATDYLRNQIKLHVHHKIYWKLYAAWQFNFQDRKGTYLDYESNTEKHYQPYVLCNLKLMLRLDKVQVFAEATNLFNSKHFDLGNIPQPGIWVKGGISVNVF